MKIEPPNQPKSKINILLVTPYPIIQKSLQILIEGNRDICVVDMVPCFDCISDKNYLGKLDIILIYLMDNDTETVESISKFLGIIPSVKVIIVTNNKDFNNQTRAVQLGAVGIVQKEQSAKILIEAIRQTNKGETWINQVLLSKLFQEKNHTKNGLRSNDFLKAQTITSREKEVIVLIGKGLKNKDIASKLGISEATVRHHLSSIYGKAGVEDRLNLVIYAYQKGLINLSEKALPIV
jgi:DNA-binding NarL/FixJ family response regulator